MVTVNIYRVSISTPTLWTRISFIARFTARLWDPLWLLFTTFKHHFWNRYLFFFKFKIQLLSYTSNRSLIYKKWPEMFLISTLTYHYHTKYHIKTVNIHTKCFLYLHQMFTLLLFTPNYVQYPHQMNCSTFLYLHYIYTNIYTTSLIFTLYLH